MKRVLFVISILIAVAIIAFVLLNSQQPPQLSAAIVGLQANDSMVGYARATNVRPFKFPDDHGPHPDFQTEWWYYTGNLESADGRRFGYQLTFFRRAITPPSTAAQGATPRATDWATNQIYFAHFALTDAKNNRHDATERFSRGAANLAGASGTPFRVWIENWSVETQNFASLPSDASSMQLRADNEGRSINLTLTSSKPPVLQGNRGLSAKSDEPGNASYYISFTRMKTSGTVTVNGEQLQVSGDSWMDHEWSTAALGPNAVGWDWFSIQLSDNRELMLFQIRNKDGSIEPVSSGTLVEPDGTTHYLPRDQFKIVVPSTWTSNTTRATYPARWSVAVPSANIQIDLKPIVADQEMILSIVYWEGAVDISGQSNGKPVTGRGFVEMTGYAKISGQ
jgi:predicted secreted hydrolase